MKLLRNNVPALQYGAKITPDEIAGVLGLPQVGNIWYVDGVNGSDANIGDAWDQSFATLYAAHAAATDNNYDVIVIASSGVGAGSGTDESVYGAWTFSKNLVAVLGAAAPSRYNPRERVLWDTAGQSTSSALLTISGSGNLFVNFMFGTFVDNNILVTVTGQRNLFDGVHFAGIGDDTAGNDTAARSLVISGAGENNFVRCTFGVDTVTRSVANASVELTGSCPRNRFEDCEFPMFADNAGAFWVKADTGNCYERSLVFKDCKFLNPVNASSTTLTAGMKLSATGNGDVFLIGSGSFWIGATDLSTDYTNLYSNIPVFDTADAGKAAAITT